MQRTVSRSRRAVDAVDAGCEAIPRLLTYIILGLCIFQCASKERLQLQIAALGNTGTHQIKEKAQELFAKYRSTTLPLAQGSTRRRVAYTCTMGDLCGGLGDRMKGFASTFVLALLLDAEFVVEWTHPVSIESFFRMSAASNATALRLDAKNATSWSLIDAHSHSSELHKLRKMNFGTLWEGHDFVSVHLNGAVWNHFVMNDHLIQAGDKYTLNRYSKRQLFEVVMKEFFSSPMPALKSYVLSNFLKLHGTFHVGVQIRLGGHWGDGKRYNGDVNDVVSCFVSETLRTCQESACPRNCSVFLTTDQADAVPLLTNALKPHYIGVYTTKGETVHSEKSDGDQMHHLKTFGDWYLLTLMSKLVSSRSGFAETASWFGNVPSRGLSRASSCLFYEEGVEVPDGAEFFNQLEER